MGFIKGIASAYKELIRYRHGYTLRLPHLHFVIVQYRAIQPIFIKPISSYHCLKIKGIDIMAKFAHEGCTLLLLLE
jgi:hypothetical protein